MQVVNALLTCLNTPSDVISLDNTLSQNKQSFEGMIEKIYVYTERTNTRD